MKKIIITALMVSGLLAPLILGGCHSPLKTPAIKPAVSSTSDNQGFAIYLTKDNVPVAQMEALSHVDIADTPVVALNDIVAYHWDTQSIELTAAAYQRVMQLQVPTNGKSFVVCVDKAPVYWGAFWTPISSASFSGIIINVMPYSNGNSGNIVKLEPGYPAPDFSKGGDPRSNQIVKASLEKSGKLK